MEADYTNRESDELVMMAREVDDMIIQQDLRLRLEKQKEMDDSQNHVVTQLAAYDTQISLPNGVLFNEILNKSLSQAKRYHKHLAILLIDIDVIQNEKLISNYQLSQAAVREMSDGINKTIRSEDTVAKLDGRLFIILLPEISKPKFASTVAYKLINSISSSSMHEQNFIFKPHIGITIYPSDGESLEELINNAYMALYKAKQDATHPYCFYSTELNIVAREYMQLMGELRTAIFKKELTIYYQPKIQVTTGHIVGVEALIRWIHPRLGILSADKIIPMAEEAGLIREIGEWACREACLTNKFWQNEGYEHISVSFNLSPQQFNMDFISMIKKILDETGLNPNYLECEITESTIMHDLNDATSILDKLQETGVQISMDHFGTGYTSISHLKRFPITIIKIDQDYIKGIPNNATDSAIASGIIALAHSLSLIVVAEGVETAEQVEFLSAQGCDIMQGYYLSYPAPAYIVSDQFIKLSDKVMM